MNAYKCRIKPAITFLILGDALGPVALMTFSVKFGSKRDTFVVEAPFVEAMLAGTPGGKCNEV